MKSIDLYNLLTSDMLVRYCLQKMFVKLKTKTSKLKTEKKILKQDKIKIKHLKLTRNFFYEKEM